MKFIVAKWNQLQQVTKQLLDIGSKGNDHIFKTTLMGLTQFLNKLKEQTDISILEDTIPVNSEMSADTVQVDSEICSVLQIRN